MSDKSDHSKARTNIFELLPEVYHSEINESIFETAFNRHLTKDDTARVAGYIGEGNRNAVVRRQISEPTPHRQAYQLQPTMYTKIGDVEATLTYKSFLTQLELMGVDQDRIPLWANTTQFNWVPPINVDKLVNYSNYYWKPEDPRDPTQYFTIEDRCRQAKSKTGSYQSVIEQRGAIHRIGNIIPSTNAFVIGGTFEDLFVGGFVFFTKNTTDVNVSNRYWTTASSTFDPLTNTTIIVVVEPIAFTGEIAPALPVIGAWWYVPSTRTLHRWNSTAWIPLVAPATGDISLEELLNVYQIETNCACNQDKGWDIGLWDDNQVGTVVWNAPLLAAISSLVAPVSPVLLDLWYNTGVDILHQYNGTAWIAIINSFSTILSQTNGKSRWDLTIGCEPQLFNQWSTQNQWIHKTEVTSFDGISRARIPILEYNSSVELNSWTRVLHSWKYRSSSDTPFVLTETGPSRIELEPIKAYTAYSALGVWYINLYSNTSTSNRDIDYTDTFTPGSKFRITDDAFLSELYTVETSTYELVGGQYVTVLSIVEDTFLAPITADTVIAHTRIIPLTTSQGHTWRGYHVHWVLDTALTTTAPTGSQSRNPLLVSSLINDTIATFVTGVGTQLVGSNHQESTIEFSGISTVNLNTTFLYSPILPNNYATPGSNELRVYVNDIRQYGNYIELAANGVPNYTLIGDDAYFGMRTPYITGVTFSVPLNLFDVVRLEVGSASFHDMGMFSVPVRTIEDETAFAAAIVATTQPAYISLVEYQKNEQNKQDINQYPLFDVYDVCTNDVVKASPIFAYKEQADCAINPDVQRRIVASSDGREFGFIQYLLDHTDNVLYAYRNLTHVLSSYWFNAVANELKFWDGHAWTSNIITQIPSRVVVRIPVVAAIEPVALLTLDGSYWFNTATNILYQRNTATSQWTVLGGVVINDTDPSLQTVWKTGTSQYVPAFVNGTRTPVAVGSPGGDWELFDQWFFNPEHSNRAEVSFAQLSTHFSSIVNQQPTIPGLIGGGVYTLTQDAYNYSLGGTIKDHNDSFDTLISAVNVTNITPIGVIEFAESQYSSSLLVIRELFNRHSTELFSTFTTPSLVNQNKFITDSVVEQYKLNEFAASTYGDTTAYDATTNVGLANWIATIPMFGLGPKYQPHLTTDDGFVEVFHHDGHRSIVSFSVAEETRFSLNVISRPDLRVSNGTLGVQSTTAPPNSDLMFVASFGGVRLRTGVYWYRQGGGFNQLYKFAAISVSPVAPSFISNGVEINNGVMYYNTLEKTVYQKVALTWVAITASGAGDISPLWSNVSLSRTLGGIYFELEKLLFAATPTNTIPSFDYATLTPTPSERAVYDDYLQSRFASYMLERSIRGGLINTTYSAVDAFTWNYATSLLNAPPTTSIVAPIPSSSWQEAYTRWYGTPYPHYEPWVLQGYTGKPSWWDNEYLNNNPIAYGTRRWKYIHATTTGMWQNIKLGIVPSGQKYPSGLTSTGNATTDGQFLRTYDYFSVNIGDVTTADGYAPDDVLPPYYDSTLTGSTIRSLYSLFNAEIIAPASDYIFGEGSPIEWAWRVSSQYRYDLPIIAFRMQPARFLHAAFGPRFTNVDRLQVETTLCQVYTHKDALFHGDIYSGNQVYKVNGLNQWYVNYNRYSGFDTNAEFRALWAGWTPKLSYQFAGIIDTGTFEIFNKFFEVAEQEYNIILSNSGVIKDVWVDAFEVSVLTIPPAIIQYNNQSLWKFELDTLSSTPRTIEYYGAKVYQFAVDVATNVCTVYNYPILQVEPASKRFYVIGDQSSVFVPGLLLTVTNSSGNNGTYTTTSSVYNANTDRTYITVAEPINNSANDGKIDVATFILPWNTGDTVFIATSKQLPAPLVPDIPYFVIKLSDKTFKLAETFNDALSNIAVDFTSGGDGEVTIGEVASSFNVFAGNSSSTETWYHYALDKNKVRTFAPPYVISGMQDLIGLIDGYQSYQEDQGVRFNLGEASETDAETGRTVNWQLEIERFIDWAYSIRNTRLQVSDRYVVSVTNLTTNELTFADAVPAWIDGTPVVVSTTGTLPSPLIANTLYYVVSTAVPGIIKLSTSKNTSIITSHVDITTIGSGITYTAIYTENNVFPSFEINPIRNNVWIDTPQGVLSDIVKGPYADIRTNQTIFDQFSRPITPDNINVYRQDKISRISVLSEIPNDVQRQPLDFVDPYNYLHIGGGHFFLEGYEHVLLFNDYTISNALIYDAFLGLNSKKFDLDYFEKQDYTLRPTLGGFYLLDGKFHRNIEGSTDDLKNIYDVYAIPETSTEAKRARNLVGYRGPANFLNLLNANTKTQFLFHRGMIQSKGSVNSVRAYINSRRFIDAKIDEFWAWKIADFGDSRPQVFPQIKLFATDSTEEDVRLEFLAASEFETDVDVAPNIINGFKPISFRDGTRWDLFPEQRTEIESPLFLDALISSMISIYSGTVELPVSQRTQVDFWYNPVTSLLQRWGLPSTGGDITDSSVSPAIVESNLSAWGAGGQLGVAGTFSRSSPVQIPGTTWNNISAGTGNTLATRTDGTLWAWGDNTIGQLGDGTIVSKSSPVQIPGTTWNTVDHNSTRSFAIRTDGTLWGWGSNSGLLGDSTSTNRSSPVQISGMWNRISVGLSHAVAVKTDGTLWAWGQNDLGQLGIGTSSFTIISTPMQIGSDTTWNNIAAGFFHTMATKTNGTLWAWGFGGDGQLGDGTNSITSQQSLPIQIPGTTWSNVATALQCTVATKTDGTLWAWGINSDGQLGDGSFVSKSSPVQIPGTTWDKISAGNSHVLATKTDGTLWAWGLNSNGQLGNGTPAFSYPSPVQVLGTLWNKIDAGGFSSLATLTSTPPPPPPPPALIGESSAVAWVPVSGKIYKTGNTTRLLLDELCDDVRVVQRTLITPGNVDLYTSQILAPGIGASQYTLVNSEILEINTNAPAGMYLIFTVNPAKTKISPAKLLDTKSRVVIREIPLWDPARGDHYHLALHNIDLIVQQDPAKYNITVNPQNISTLPWNATERGTRWLDTNSLSYFPYYDSRIYPNVNDRLYKWGKLAPWASAKVYEWVASPVPPVDWDSFVTTQQNAVNIPQSKKASGTTRKTVFKRTRTPLVATITGLPSSTSTINVGTHSLQVNDFVLVTATVSLPTHLGVAVVEAGTFYVVASVSGNNISIANDIGAAPILFNVAAVGTMHIVPAFKAGDWVKQPLTTHRFLAAMNEAFLALNPTFTVPNNWTTGDAVDVYVNAQLVFSNLVVNGSRQVATTGLGLQLTTKDIVVLVRPIRELTDAESAFDPNTEDDGTVFINWKEDSDYTSIITTVRSRLITTYYFWVEGSTARDETDNTNLSVAQTAADLVTIPIPYFMVQKPKDDPVQAARYIAWLAASHVSDFSSTRQSNQPYAIPVLYRQAILRNASNLLVEDDRIALRFTRDFSLRDNLNDSQRKVNLKNKHEEWLMFRQEQPSTIPRELWDKLIEALIGQSLVDPTVRVPSLERELYDALHETDTRFGLGKDQAFVDKTLALSTVLKYLLTPSYDFSPVDVDSFFERNKFDTPTNIKAAMQEIYNSFQTTHVNAIWFETLHDALSTKAKYQELIKTSWVAVHGIRLLEIGGLFDD